MYVAIITKGMVLDQRVIAVGDDVQALEASAQRAAQQENVSHQGMEPAYEVQVLPFSIGPVP